MSKPLKLHHVAAALGMDVGCGDNSCIWGSPVGMATNGGCRCRSSKGGPDERLTLSQMQRVAQHLLAENALMRIALGKEDAVREGKEG